MSRLNENKVKTEMRVEDIENGPKINELGR